MPKVSYIYVNIIDVVLAAFPDASLLATEEPTWDKALGLINGAEPAELPMGLNSNK